MARALTDILTELNTTYNPRRQAQTDVYNQNLAAVDPQQQADLSGLEAAKKDSFSQIETGANRRGMFFSGIPLAEQAKYVGQNYLPAVANLQNRYAQIRGNLRQSLADTLANIDTEQRKFGQDIYGQEVATDLERERIAAAERASRATAASGSGFNPTFSTTGGGQVLGATKVNPADQQLYNQMFVNPKGGQWGNQELVNDYNATLTSARYGNVADQKKIQFYHSFRPDLFGGNLPSFAAPQQAAVTPQAVRQATPQTYSSVVSAPKLFGN